MDALTSLMGPLGPMFLLGAAGFALILAAGYMALSGPGDRFDKIRTERETGAAAGRAGHLRTEGRAEKLQRFSSFLEPQDEEELSAMRLRLMRAGYRSKDAVRLFHFAQFGAALGLLALGIGYVMIQGASGAQMSPTMMAVYVLGPALVGYMIPKRFIAKRVQAREDEIVAGFPDSLDLMLVCVEAGQSIDQSIGRVANELTRSYPALGLEYMTVSQEMKAGKAKDQVFRDMAERCGVSDITSFCTTLIQSQSFGTSVSEALKVYAEEMRDKRVMRAEEKANTLPTKMTLATMGLTLPPLLIILLGPSIHSIVYTMNQ